MLPRQIVTWPDPALSLKITDFAAGDDKKPVWDEDRIKLLELSTHQKPCRKCMSKFL